MDSGPLVAPANPSDPDYFFSVAALEIPGLRLVIAEAAHFVGGRGRALAEARFPRDHRDFDVRAPLPDEWPRIAALVEKYADLGLGAVDTSVIVLPESFGIDLIIGLDHRHFRVVRPQDCAVFRLLPAELP